MNLINFSMFKGNGYSKNFNTVVYIGTATGGPLNTPFTLHADTDPFEVLGDTPLAHAFQASKDAGNVNCMLYRVNGIHGSATLTNKDGLSLLTIKSLEANESLNTLEIRVYPNYLWIKEPNDDYRVYEFANYENSELLVDAINQDAYYGLTNYYAVLENEESLTNMLDEGIEFKDLAFGGGSAEEHLIIPRLPTSIKQVDKEEVYKELMIRFKNELLGEDKEFNTTLSEMDANVFVPCDIYFDECPEIFEMMKTFCEYKTMDTVLGASAILNTSPTFSSYTDGESNNNLKEKLVEKRNLLIAESNKIDALPSNRYIEVVVGHQIDEDRERIYPFSYGYGATKALNEADYIMTNKILGKNYTFIDNFRKEDIALLERSGYICIVTSIRRGHVANRSQSFMRDSNDVYKKPHHTRIVQYIIFNVRKMGLSLVGQNHNQFSLDSLKETINNFLNQMIAEEKILSYKNDIFINNYTREIAINLEINLVSEIEKVHASTIIQFPGRDS